MNIGYIFSISIKTIIFVAFLLLLHYCIFWAVKNESGQFQKIVLIISIILYNFLIVLYWYTITYIKSNNWGSNISSCPDYFEDVTCGDIPCNPSERPNTLCKNVLGLGTVPSNSVVMFPKDESTCDKYNWSTKYGVYWDGVSNLNTPC
jgi:hypothetical protein